MCVFMITIMICIGGYLVNNVIIKKKSWIGAGVIILKGVTIGENCVVASGSVVTKDIPSGVIAAGNPCRVIRKITEADRDKYKKSL